MSIIKELNAITAAKAVLCGFTGQIIFGGFIPTMQFVGKQHNLTLKVLNLSSMHLRYFVIISPWKTASFE